MEFTSKEGPDRAHAGPAGTWNGDPVNTYKSLVTASALHVAPCSPWSTNPIQSQLERNEYKTLTSHFKPHTSQSASLGTKCPCGELHLFLSVPSAKAMASTSVDSPRPRRCFGTPRVQGPFAGRAELHALLSRSGGRAVWHGGLPPWQILHETSQALKGDLEAAPLRSNHLLLGLVPLDRAHQALHPFWARLDL